MSWGARFPDGNEGDGSPLVEGMTMTGVTDKQVEELRIDITPQHPETELRKQNANFVSKRRSETSLRPMWRSMAILSPGKTRILLARLPRHYCDCWRRRTKMRDFIMKHKRAFIVGAVVLILLVAGGVWFLNNLPDFAVEVLFNSAVSANQMQNILKRMLSTSSRPERVLPCQITIGLARKPSSWPVIRSWCLMRPRQHPST